MLWSWSKSNQQREGGCDNLTGTALMGLLRLSMRDQAARDSEGKVMPFLLSLAAYGSKCFWLSDL
jgi:hypothetical protein